ncbi:hypothetical protein [uncultured Hyphomicrobium sp.]|uniref:hypothetical protein n=1 Tax=uncultured Hyphomicrobium sp. TaxID=194373 RepID=UPI0025F7B760|nr:hypothetical protein [uncultured Hyphomicrobium sp.]
MTERSYATRSARSNFHQLERDVFAFILSNGRVTREQIVDFIDEPDRTHGAINQTICWVRKVAGNNGIRVITSRKGHWHVHPQDVNRAHRLLYGKGEPRRVLYPGYEVGMAA